MYLNLPADKPDTVVNGLTITWDVFEYVDGQGAQKGKNKFNYNMGCI